MIFGFEPHMMVAHKKIILQWGAVFLLVALKIHIASSKSLTDNGLHPQELNNISSTPSHNNSFAAETVPTFKLSGTSEIPVENYNLSYTSRSYLSKLESEVLPNADINNSFSFIPKKKEFEAEHFHFNSSVSFNRTLNVESIGDSDQYLESQNDVKQASNFSTLYPFSNSTTGVPAELLDDDILDIKPPVVDKIDNSNITVVKEEIEHFGENIKRLKENVHSIKDNLRKILFEADSSANQNSGENHTVPSTLNNRSSLILQSDEVNSRTSHELHNSTSAVPKMINGSSPILKPHSSSSTTTLDSKLPNNSKTSHMDSYSGLANHRRERISSKPGSLEFSKISAVASNISEVSRRVGAFLQEHYWDSKSGNKDQQQEEMISRGLENLVDGVEESELPSSQVLQQWVNLEESFRESVDAVVRQALPLLVRASSEMQLSNGCYTSFFQLLLGLRRLRPWAFQMIDAFGKPPAGMLQGTVTSFGAYDECVNIVAMSDPKKKIPSQQYFRGKYCTVEIKPPLPPKPQYYTMYEPVSILANFSNGDDNVIRQAARQAHAFYFLTYRMDICVPSTCTQDDVNNMAQFAAKYIDIEVTVPRCSVKESLYFDKTQVVIICIVGVLLSFVLFGTILDIIREIFYKTKLITKCFTSALVKLLLSFSLNTNADQLLNTDSAQNGLDSVHGMRFFGMGWLILGHTYFNSNVQMYGNLSEASAFAEGFLFQIIVNSTVSIDTFFFISAVLLSYLTLQGASKHGYYSIPRLFFRRLIRILPTYMMVISATFILPHLGSGPFWNETVDPVVDSCKQNWWTNLLFINNFVTTPGQRCLEHSWYISCDFQLFIIALFILLALIKRPMFGMALNVIMIMVSMVMTGLLTYYYKVPPTLLASFPDPEERKFLNHVIISKPFCHLGPYCVGLATGYFFYKCKEIKLKPYHHIIGWGSAISVTAAVVYGVLEWNKGNLPSTPAALAYAATHRTAWALGLSWITIICVAGYGGLINSILSWKVFIPLSRLTCMVYLIHPLIQYILTGYIRERLQTNHIILAYFSWTYHDIFGLSCSLLLSSMSVEALFCVIFWEI
ncbi:Nose resistant to fluoxetine protein 6 like protein [Argiope bruennichi]|uniref:Nose resistant to fluoxetine protein 6 like protein n=1 Tax=Argiope bruennichi TaxID=94029 RepID=A0A8T0EE84_ARGBR|nr:Nose resistant to fluoxetine protein 6 like protein [Argiope bruennichi]